MRLLRRIRERLYRGPTEVEITCATMTYMGRSCPVCWRPESEHAEWCQSPEEMSFEDAVVELSEVFDVDPTSFKFGPVFAP